jgi:hypothetical protein
VIHAASVHSLHSGSCDAHNGAEQSAPVLCSAHAHVPVCTHVCTRAAFTVQEFVIRGARSEDAVIVQTILSAMCASILRSGTR